MGVALSPDMAHDPYIGTTISFYVRWQRLPSGLLPEPSQRRGILRYVSEDTQVAVVSETIDNHTEHHVVDVWAYSLGSYGPSALARARRAADLGRIPPEDKQP
jgi:hypothetical protein